MSIESNESKWRPLSQADLTQVFVYEFQQEEPDRAIISEWFATMFERQTGLAIDRTDLQKNQVYARWLAYQEFESEIPFHIRKYPRMHHLVYSSYSTKISSIGQRHCYICQPGGPIHVMPIRITPRSRQNIEKLDRKAFHAAVAHWAFGRQLAIDVTKNICLAVTFVLDARGRDKDLDNMIKILQDAIADSFNFNDRNVHHLDLIKLIMPVDEEYMYVRIMNSRVNEDHDVLAPIEHHSFGCGPPLMLEDFLATNSEAASSAGTFEQ